jgi:hypothetical protein
MTNFSQLSENPLKAPHWLDDGDPGVVDLIGFGLSQTYARFARLDKRGRTKKRRRNDSQKTGKCLHKKSFGK